MAQAPSLAFAASSNPHPTLAFEETVFDDVREGYVSLAWNPVEGASEYIVTEHGGVTPYRGAFRKAFVSGLADGTYRYQVRAYDESGTLLLESTTDAVVQVNHWPLWQAIALFVMGLLLFLTLISVIVLGASSSGRESH
ncbi:hypothetical protein [Novipirellula artificiosorum]|uniref:hypothetical protein n=1 Tax=Novipirellula artificiosorum TaxID=2528016 RepID=UPI0011B75E8C|nr:hypothetical protein [Novipirellula artificiosorum]